jgi:ribulose-phosphate 3-epimerase
MVEEVLANIDLLLVMTINPGFGGQVLIPTTVDKVRRARTLLDAQRSAATLQVDGGVKSHNAAALTRAGATCLVVGTGIFEAPGGIQTGVMELRQAIEGA